MKEPRPYYRKSRRIWYVQIDGKEFKLGPDRGAAFNRYHELMATRSKPLPPSDTPYVAEVLDKYLDWLAHRVQDGSKAQRTYDWYKMYLQSFLKTNPTLLVSQLQPRHVYEWVDSQPNWKTGKRGAMTAIQRAFSWAQKAGHCQSPIRHLEKPSQGRRDLLVTPEQYRGILESVRDKAFRYLLELAWETGARPDELFTVEVSFVDLPGSRWIFPLKESKGKKVQRVVYLNDRATEITKLLMAKHKSGPLLRNTDGKPWCVSSVKCRFQRLRKKLRVRYNLYSFRHAFVTYALASGKLDAVTVSLLAGHRDTQMISRHYSHLVQLQDHLRDAAKKAKGA